MILLLIPLIFVPIKGVKGNFPTKDAYQQNRVVDPSHYNGRFAGETTQGVESIALMEKPIGGFAKFASIWAPNELQMIANVFAEKVLSDPIFDECPFIVREGNAFYLDLAGVSEVIDRMERDRLAIRTQIYQEIREIVEEKALNVRAMLLRPIFEEAMSDEDLSGLEIRDPRVIRRIKPGQLVHPSIDGGARIGAIYQQVASAKHTVFKETPQMSRRHNEVDALRTELAERDQLISEMHSQIEHLRRQNVYLEQKMAEMEQSKRRQSVAMDTQLAQKQQQMAEFGRQIGEAEKYLAKFEGPSAMGLHQYGQAMRMQREIEEQEARERELAGQRQRMMMMSQPQVVGTQQPAATGNSAAVQRMHQDIQQNLAREQQLRRETALRQRGKSMPVPGLVQMRVQAEERSLGRAQTRRMSAKRAADLVNAVPVLPSAMFAGK